MPFRRLSKHLRGPLIQRRPGFLFVVVSRQALIDSTFSTVVCAPVFTQWYGLPTQVSVGTAEGLKHESAIQCDGLMSLEKPRLTDYVGELTFDKLRELDDALLVALALPVRKQTSL